MSSQDDWSHTTVLPAATVSPSLARDFVSRMLVRHDLSALVEDVRLVVSELATNVVTHAHTSLALTLSSRGGVVRLRVQDRSTDPVARRTPRPLDVGGRGLVIVEQVAQQWGADIDRDGVKSVWALFPARAERHATV